MRRETAEASKAESLALSARSNRGAKATIGGSIPLAGASGSMGLGAFTGECSSRVAIPEDSHLPLPFPLSAMARDGLQRASTLYPDTNGLLHDELLTSRLTSPVTLSLSGALAALLQHLGLHLDATLAAWQRAKHDSVSDGSWALRPQEARDVSDRAIAHLSHLASLAQLSNLLSYELSDGELPEAGSLICRVFDAVTNSLRHHGACPPAGRPQLPIFKAFSESSSLRDVLSEARSELRSLTAARAAKASSSVAPAGKKPSTSSAKSSASATASASLPPLTGRAKLANEYIRANYLTSKTAKICVAYNGHKGCARPAKKGAPPASASQPFTCSGGWLHRCCVVGCSGLHSLFKTSAADCPLGHAAGAVP